MVGREVDSRAPARARARSVRSRIVARGRASSAAAATAASRRCKGCRCRSVPGRSSASPASPGTASASSPRRSAACAPRRRGEVRVDGRAAAAGRPARGDRGRDRARARGPSRHRCRAEPEHRCRTRSSSRTGAGRSRAGPLLRHRTIRERAREPDRPLRREDARTADVRRGELSGGNLQKLVLGREFAGEPRVLIAASPTRGLDVGAIETVHAYLREAAADGVAILLISEDLDEILALADRVVVMYEGGVAGEVDPAARDGRGDRPADGGRRRGDPDRAAAAAAALAVGGRAARVASPSRSRVIAVRPGRHARGRALQPMVHVPAPVRRRVRRGRRRSAATFDLGDAAPLHRSGRGGSLPDEPVQHRRRGPALLRRRRRGRCRACCSPARPARSRSPRCAWPAAASARSGR